MARNKIQTTIYLEPRQLEALEALRKSTRLPVAIHIRDAIDAYLEALAKEQRGRAAVADRESALQLAAGGGR